MCSRLSAGVIARERGECAPGLERKLRKNAASSVIVVREMWSDTLDSVGPTSWLGL